MANNVMKREETMPRSDGHENQAERFMQPRTSVFETGDNVVLELEMPGVTRDRIDVTVEKDELTVTGWRQAEEYDRYEVLHRERIPMNFRRTFVLSDIIDTGKIAAACNDGVLRLTLPKADVAKPKKIIIE